MVCPGVELPLVPRGKIEASLQGVSDLPFPDDSSSARTPLPPYRALLPGQCQCLAARASVVARLQEQEGELLAGTVQGCLFPGPRSRAATAPVLVRALLAQASLEAQNRSAGAALELYYRLGEAEGQADLLAESLVAVRAALEKTRGMERQQLRPPVDSAVYHRRLLTLRAEQVQLELTITRLNEELQRLLGLPGCPARWRVWNPEGYRIESVPADAQAVEVEVARGLACRPELVLLRLAISGLDADSLPAIQQLLKTVHPMLGLDRRPGGSVLKRLVSLLRRATPGLQHGGVEVQARRQQLGEYLHNREQAVAGEIRQAAREMEARVKLAALARERVRSWQDRVEQLRGQHARGLATFDEVTAAVQEWIRARSVLLQEVMAWNTARVRLRQAQGMLALECAPEGAGFSPAGSKPSRAVPGVPCSPPGRP